VTTAWFTDLAPTPWIMGLAAPSWLLAHMSMSWLMGIAPLAAMMVVWFVCWRTKGTEGGAILYTGLAMGVAQLAMAAWIIWRS
jgi:hypothetical protein